MRDYGRQGPHSHAEAGLNSRLDELQAALLRSALLPRLDRSLARRHEVASRYTEALAATTLRPVAANGGHSAHHLFPVEATRGDADELATRLAQRGIPTGRHYPILCPDQPALGGRGVVVGSLAVARRIAEWELSLPLHPYLRDDEVEAVVEACRDAAA